MPSVDQQTGCNAVSYGVRWCMDPIETEPIQLGSGKVKALTRFYDSLRGGSNTNNLTNLTKHKGLSSSTPNLSAAGKVDEKEKVDKLSSIEEEEILNQLKHWSEFGSLGENIDKPSCSLHRSVSCEDSISNLSNEDRGKCQYLDKVYDKLDGQRQSISRSCVNLNEYSVVDYGWNSQPPDGFLLKKVKLCKKNCTKIENNRIKLQLMFTGSCPSLNTIQPTTTSMSSTTRTRPFSPCQPTPKQTLRQLKKQQNLIKVLKAINRKYAPYDPTATSNCKHQAVPPDDIRMQSIPIPS